ncbi:MAG: UDP-N-acetylglucosamine 2-epimerase (non-hydrolyzing) [Anaerolineae bacterium]|nr:UDP-N-acetylglucosamine 2-epimerase (non-hydrolyzing) [Anaerolineae bacterium]
MVRVVSIVGARPQFIKAAMVSRALRRQAEEVLVHTGQHYDVGMSQCFFDELDLPDPDVSLGVGSGSHAEQTAGMMIGIERVLLEQKPDWALVYGDTNSTLAGALAAAKLGVAVAHVEAGLRSFDRSMPEEINRVLTDRVSTLLFCPTSQAVQNLAAEGICQGVVVVGDVMRDMLEYYLPLARQCSTIRQDLGLGNDKYALATVHRAANTDDPVRLKAIFDGLGSLPMPVILPLHPRTRHALAAQKLRVAQNVHMIDPLGYLDNLALQAAADCILTDSGGMQKEAYWLGVRCITLREETEWVETVQAGWNVLVGADTAAIVRAVETFHPSSPRPNLYGDGDSAVRIAGILCAEGKLVKA